jgi:hypothetical protein
MRDSRLQVFRAAADGLIESLEAVIRLSRWSGPEGKPEPLLASEAKLSERLGVANRLAASRFQGSATEVAKVDAICVVLRQLDAAYLTYRQGLPLAADHGADASAALETELTKATSSSAAWR